MTTKENKLHIFSPMKKIYKTETEYIFRPNKIYFIYFLKTRKYMKIGQKIYKHATKYMSFILLKVTK